MVNVPDVEFILQSIDTDPSGFRNAKSGNGFVKVLDTSVTGALDFGSVDISSSGQVSDTKLVFARVNNLGDASGVFNMKFFINSASAFSTGTYRFLERKTLHFIPNLTLTEDNDDTPVVLPTQANLSGTITEPEFPLGKPWMSGTLDNDASQYIYLATYVDTNVPIGIKGGPGAGSFRYRLFYDFS